MIVLGLLLLAVAAAAVVVAVLSGAGSVAVTVLGTDLDVPLWSVYAVGVGTGLLMLLGVLTLVAGVGRVRARREEIEYLRRKVAEHERHSGDDSEDVGSWLGHPHGRNRAESSPAEPAARPGPTSGVAPLYRQG